MSELDYTEIERPVEPAFSNEDPEGWCEVLAWEEARADRLEQENAELKEILSSLLHQAKSSAEKRHILEQDEFQWAVNRLNKLNKE